MKHLLAIFSSALLAACATPYSPPSSGPTARIRIYAPQTHGTASVVTMGYASGTCSSPMKLGMIGGVARLLPEEPLGIPGREGLTEKAYIERVIPAGTPYLLSTRGLYESKLCLISSLLYPKAGQDYEARYSWGGGQCFLFLTTIEKSPQGDLVKGPSGFDKADRCEKGFN